MPRGKNYRFYRYHIHGTIGDVEINCKCTSFNEFLEKFGGDKTPLGLHRRKLHRLRSGYYREGGNVAKMWKTIQIDNIKEKVEYVRADEVQLNIAPEKPPAIDPMHTLAEVGPFTEVVIDENGDVVDVMHDDI